MISAIHDVRSYVHGRDIRCLQWFLRPSVRRFIACPVRVVEVINNSSMSAIHVFGDQASGEPLYLLAHRGHLRWALPTGYTRPGDWKLWRREAEKAISQPESDWGEFTDSADYDYQPDYVQCKYCPSWRKVELPDWCVGGAEPAQHDDAKNPVSRNPLPNESESKRAPPRRRHSTESYVRARPQAYLLPHLSRPLEDGQTGLYTWQTGPIYHCVHALPELSRPVAGLPDRSTETAERFHPPTITSHRPNNVQTPAVSKPSPPDPPDSVETKRKVETEKEYAERAVFAGLGSTDNGDHATGNPSLPIRDV